MFRDLSVARSFHGVSLARIRRIFQRHSRSYWAGLTAMGATGRAGTKGLFFATLAMGICSIWLPAVRASLPQGMVSPGALLATDGHLAGGLLKPWRF